VVGRRIVFFSGSSCSQAGANIALRIHFDYIGEGWASQDLHILNSGLCPGVVTPVPLFTATESTQEETVTSYKPVPIGVGPGTTGFLQQWMGPS